MREVQIYINKYDKTEKLHQVGGVVSQLGGGG